MYAKGVDYFIHVSEITPDVRTRITAPRIDRTFASNTNFQPQNLQISSKNIPGFTSFTGTLTFATRRGAVEVARQFQDINSFTGKIGRGTMGNMFNTPPHIGETTVCWGFYDAGPGKKGGVSILTNQMQLYVYATRDQRRWMTELAAADPRIARGAFNRFALPGAHDAGMFDMSAVLELLRDRSLANDFLRLMFDIPVVGPVLSTIAGFVRAASPRGIANLAMTQKDSVAAMLDVGTRYFDFRPGTMHPKIARFRPGVRFHQHALIPGYPYISFLVDVLRWLDGNPGEIVVVSANTQGLIPQMRPSAADVQTDLDTAFARTGLAGKILTGGKHDLTRSYEDLVRSGTRLIFLNQIEGETRKYDSYDGRAYATLRPEPIIRAFEAMQRTVPNGEDYVVMQMQATAPNLGSGVILPAIFTTSDASSPLMATKAVIDAATNPWLRQHAVWRLPPDRLLVFLNDFSDNCTTETATIVTMQRPEGLAARYRAFRSAPPRASLRAWERCFWSSTRAPRPRARCCSRPTAHATAPRSAS